MTTPPLPRAPRIDAVFDFDALLSEEERDWQQKARAFAQKRILPIIEDDFEKAHFRRELIPELGAAGFLGMHLSGYGCAGAGASSVASPTSAMRRPVELSANWLSGTCRMSNVASGSGPISTLRTTWR